MSIPWKTCVAALGVPRRIRAKVAELGEDGVEVGCACLGVPKLMPSTSSRRHGAWLPGAFTSLISWSGPIVVLLCAPVAETEWYCLSEQSAFTIEGLFVADMSGEMQSITPEVLDRGTRLRDLAWSRRVEFSAIVLVAAFRAEVTRARRDGRRIYVGKNSRLAYSKHSFLKVEDNTSCKVQIQEASIIVTLC